MADSYDPRIYFASERTFLAWLRTSITIVALGFIVARFGIYLEMVGHDSSRFKLWASIIIGIALIVVGLLINIFSTVQYARFKKTLPVDHLPKSYSSTLAIFTGSAMTLTCIFLIVYLLT